jgi:hypothetical protein
VAIPRQPHERLRPSFAESAIRLQPREPVAVAVVVDDKVLGLDQQRPGSDRMFEAAPGRLLGGLEMITNAGRDDGESVGPGRGGGVALGHRGGPVCSRICLRPRRRRQRARSVASRSVRLHSYSGYSWPG